MKKTIIVSVVVLVSTVSNAFQGSQLIQQDSRYAQNENRFLDAAAGPQDEYEVNQHDCDMMNEYDQNVCDGVQPPKISAAKALLTEMLGFVLIRYITMREALRIYYKDIQESLSKWFNSITKL
jgi:hypothetical protein